MGHKLKRAEISKTLLTRFQANSNNFHRRLVAQAETWVYHFEIKDSKQTVETIWFSIFEDVQSGSVCWQRDGFFFYFEGVIMIAYLEKGKTINEQYYGSELR